MNSKEIIEDLMDRFSLTEKELSKLLNININEINKESLSKNIIDKLLTIFDIKENDLLTLKDIPNITMKTKILKNNKSNKFKCWNETMKTLYKSNTKVYVLTKIKIQKSIFSRIFKKEIKRLDINTFAPNFLIKKNNRLILVTFNEEYMLSTNLQKDTNEKEFILNGYKYKKANEIKLK